MNQKSELTQGLNKDEVIYFNLLKQKLFEEAEDHFENIKMNSESLIKIWGILFKTLKYDKEETHKDEEILAHCAGVVLFYSEKDEIEIAEKIITDLCESEKKPIRFAVNSFKLLQSVHNKLNERKPLN